MYQILGGILHLCVVETNRYNNSTKGEVLSVWKGNHTLIKGKRTKRKLYMLQGEIVIMISRLHE